MQAVRHRPRSKHDDFLHDSSGWRENDRMREYSQGAPTQRAHRDPYGDYFAFPGVVEESIRSGGWRRYAQVAARREKAVHTDGGGSALRHPRTHAKRRHPHGPCAGWGEPDPATPQSREPPHQTPLGQDPQAHVSGGGSGKESEEMHDGNGPQGSRFLEDAAISIGQQSRSP